MTEKFYSVFESKPNKPKVEPEIRSIGHQGSSRHKPLHLRRRVLWKKRTIPRQGLKSRLSIIKLSQLA